MIEATVAIRLETEDKKGNLKVKNIKEHYLVDTDVITVAEKTIHNMYKNSEYEWEITMLKKSKFNEVINVENYVNKIEKSSNNELLLD